MRLSLQFMIRGFHLPGVYRSLGKRVEPRCEHKSAGRMHAGRCLMVGQNGPLCREKRCAWHATVFGSARQAGSRSHLRCHLPLTTVPTCLFIECVFFYWKHFFRAFGLVCSSSSSSSCFFFLLVFRGARYFVTAAVPLFGGCRGELANVGSLTHTHKHTYKNLLMVTSCAQAIWPIALISHHVNRRERCDRPHPGY